MTDFENIKNHIETLIQDLPVFEYGFLTPEQIPFTEKVRTVCRLECKRYGSSWSCPPAVGTVPECRERCMAYRGAFFFSTVHEVRDSMNLTESFQTKLSHEQTTGLVEQRMRKAGLETYRLSGDSCSICPECTYPEKPCRFPDRMHPCIEGHGIVVAKLAESCGMEYYIDEHTQLWFSLIFYR
ncbi:DUF2284 domain-containing protein [Bilifractor sp. LCP21S3_A7]|jgi:predicted metal-binding protein|uniref:DUF2284 domain-containing protein n=1 Tax=Bilifractor sp. LCP21S3_A7 TaxID=3438738 RepID=UPI003F908C0A